MEFSTMNSSRNSQYSSSPSTEINHNDAPRPAASHGNTGISPEFASAQHAFMLLKQDFHEMRMDSKARIENLQDEAEILRRRASGLAAFMTAITVGWIATTVLFSYQIYRQSQEQANVVSPQINQVDQERLANLEQQIEQLNERLPEGIFADFQNSRDRLQQLSEQLRQVEINASGLEDLKDSIEKLGQKVLQSPAVPSAPAVLEAAQPAPATKGVQTRESVIPRKPD